MPDNHKRACVDPIYCKHFFFQAIVVQDHVQEDRIVQDMVLADVVLVYSLVCVICIRISGVKRDISRRYLGRVDDNLCHFD
jgi:hypothetical protein